MTNEIIMNCEYCIVIGNENKCKALQIETHTCLGITAKNKCPIYKIKQQLKRKEQENKDLREDIKDIANLLDLDSGEEYNFGNIESEIKQLQKYRSALEEIREDMEQDTTCESRECGCDDYAECLNCIKETILNKISEVINEKV